MLRFLRFLGWAYLALITQVTAGEPVAIPVAPEESVPAEPEVPSTPVTPKPGFGGKGMGMGGFSGPGMGGPGYSAFWFPDRPVANQNGDLGILRQRLNAGFPLWRDAGDILLMTASVQNSLFQTNAILPDSGRSFPSQLWNINLGTMYMHTFDNGWNAGAMVSFGSASDRPFNSLQEMNVSFLGMMRIPARNERDSWMFSLMYSPAGNLNFPIPGVAYQWNPSEKLQMNIGIPFSITWKPTEEFTFNASYIPLTNVNARATYKAWEKVSVFAAYEFFNEAYFLVDRVNSRDRFMGFEQRVFGGVRWELGRIGSLDFQAGYAFNRYFGEGLNQGRPLHDRIDVAPGAFLGLSYRLGF